MVIPEDFTSEFQIELTFKFTDPFQNGIALIFEVFLVIKADFLCIREITLGYNIPERISNKIGLKRLKTYIACNNLHYFTKYPGYSPEVGGEIRHNGGKYPTFRTVVFGLNIGL